MERLSLEDFLLLAEAITGLDAQSLGAVSHVVARAESALNAPFAAFGGAEFYEGLTLKAAVLCSRLLHNHPLVERLASRELVEEDFARWLARQIA